MLHYINDKQLGEGPSGGELGGGSGGRQRSPQTFRWRGRNLLCSPTFYKYLIKYKLKCLQCFPLFVYWLLCCVYNSKVTIIITLEVACYFVSINFVQALKALDWNYSLKCRGLIKRTFLDL